MGAWPNCAVLAATELPCNRIFTGSMGYMFMHLSSGSGPPMHF